MEANAQSSVCSLRGFINLSEIIVTVEFLELRSEIKVGMMETWLETLDLWSTLYSQDRQNAKKLEISCSLHQTTLASLSILKL